MTDVKSFIWRKDAAGIRGECIEMRNRVGDGCLGCYTADLAQESEGIAADQRDSLRTALCGLWG